MSKQEDAAERWLREHDPQYASNKRRWAAPSTDALNKARSDANEVHPSLEDLSELPSGHGCYRRLARSPDELRADQENEETDE